MIINKRILIIVNHDIVIYNFRKELVTRLLQEGYDIYISSPHGERLKFFEDLGCKIFNTELKRHSINIFKEYALLKNYKNQIEEINPKIVLTYTIKPNIYGGLATRKADIAHIVNITGLGISKDKFFLAKFVNLLYKISFKKTNVIFLQNEEGMRYFYEKRIYPKKTFLLPGSGVNLNEFKFKKYPEDNNLKFVFIGRIMKQKGIDLYIRAAEEIHNKYPQKNIEFHICGFLEGDYSKKIFKAKENKTIIYHGLLPSTLEILEECHCIIHPSYYPEGISNVLLEAASIGRVIITTYNSGCREVVNQGKNGYLFEAGNLNGLVENIEAFIMLSYSEKAKMGKEGRKFVEKNFDREIVIEKYLRHIEKIYR